MTTNSTTQDAVAGSEIDSAQVEACRMQVSNGNDGGSSSSNSSGSDSVGDGDSDWADWRNDGEAEEVQAPCPFCDGIALPPARIFAHTVEAHSFDFHAIRKQLALDFYGCMRLVNFIRKSPMTADELMAFPRDWMTDDQWLIPTLADDPLLYAFDEDEEDGEEEGVMNATEAPVALPAEPQDGYATTTDTATIQSLMTQLRITQTKLDQMSTAFREYKDDVRRTFLGTHVVDDNIVNQQSIVINRQDKNTVPTSKEKSQKQDWEMDYYFGSYAETEIHETMLKDAIRTEAYRNFIYNNKDVFKDRVVLDVGCGTGILSLFAARAGAKRVIAVDNSTVIVKARHIASVNGHSDVITFISGMLDSVLFARDRYLSPTGLMAPSHATMHVAAIDDADWYNDRVTFWNDVYGFNMEILKKGFFVDGQVDIVDAKTVITDVNTIAVFDTNVVTTGELDFTSEYRLTVTRDGSVHALCGWFDIAFRGRPNTPSSDATDEVFSTGPMTTPTHWKQTMFVLDTPLRVCAGDGIQGRVTCVKCTDNHRDLNVTVTVQVPARGISIPARSYQIR